MSHHRWYLCDAAVFPKVKLCSEAFPLITEDALKAPYLISCVCCRQVVLTGTAPITAKKLTFT